MFFSWQVTGMQETMHKGTATSNLSSHRVCQYSIAKASPASRGRDISSGYSARSQGRGRE